MGVRQLEEFLGQADQKGFWIFTYANLAGGFLGALIANSLMERLAPDMAVARLLAVLVGAALGMSATWKVGGRPVYGWAALSAGYLLRRHLYGHFGPDACIDSALYYRPRTQKRKPFMLVARHGGKSVPVLLHGGSGAGYKLDAPLLPLLPLLPTLGIEGIADWPAGSSIDAARQPINPDPAKPLLRNQRASAKREDA